jgi:hypothetical protein
MTLVPFDLILRRSVEVEPLCNLIRSSWENRLYYLCDGEPAATRGLICDSRPFFGFDLLRSGRFRDFPRIDGFRMSFLDFTEELRTT